MSTIGIGVSTSIGFIQVGGERLNPELVSNGDFSNGLTGWTIVPEVNEKGRMA